MSDRSKDDRRWQAVEARDPAADGRFWYSVDTTGVFCRPSCAARLPLRRHVRFHDSIEAAARAGFRPCRRCRPDGPSLAERRAEVAAAACRRIEAAEEPPTLDALAAEAGLSPHHFHRLFKAATGVTPRAYAAAARARRVQAGLRTAGTVTEAIYAAGYQASSRFYAEAEATLGMAPRRYRDGGKGEAIRFALAATALGALLVAATDTGVSAIEIGDDPDRLLADFQERFPGARLIGDDPGFMRLVALVVGFVEAPGQGLDLPLDIRGTLFQRRVWEELRRIPLGATASYAEIARRIGEPAAVRAVARACAANQLAVAVPCHRVVRTDGGLGGYRWGIERKRLLLEREAA